jgi:translation initiation factor IF-2
MRGVVIESQICKGRGAVATVVVRCGTLKVGDVVACGTSHGKVKALSDENGKRLKAAGPSTPVEVMGLSTPPPVGETLYQLEDERQAREIADEFLERERAVAAGEASRVTFSAEDFLKEPSEEAKDLRIVLKGDVQGSIEALSSVLEDAGTEKVKVDLLHTGVGPVGESDVMLAQASKAIIIAFNTRADAKAVELAEREGVTIHYYDVIYHAIEEIRAMMEGMLEPLLNEVVVGEAEILQLFKSSSLGTIAGCQVRSGSVARNLSVRLKRNDEMVWKGEILSLYHLKDEVREVKNGMECGVRLRNFQDVQVGDILEVLKVERVAQKL